MIGSHQIDLTRVTSFMLGREVSSRTYTEIGIADAHHPLSHHEYKPEKIASMSKINAYHASMFADYLARLRATPDGDGSLLDHMLFLYGCGMSDSNAHSPLNLPVLLLGGCAGQFEGGRHIRYAGDPLMPNLLVTLMGQAGRPRRTAGEERRQTQRGASDGGVACTHARLSSSAAQGIGAALWRLGRETSACNRRGRRRRFDEPVKSSSASSGRAGFRMVARYSFNS